MFSRNRSIEADTRAPEQARFTRYYEHDGQLRAYANRSMVMAGLFGVIALISLSFAIYVRLQPATVIRVSADGDATVVGGGQTSSPSAVTASLLGVQAATSTEVAPTDIEGRAVVRRFLESYMRYTPTSVDKNLADALNMMTANLRTHSLNLLRDQDLVGKIREEQITSSFKIRSIDPIGGQAWAYQAFGVKEVHRVRNKSEFTDRIVGKYYVRLIQERRNERVPSGLLVAEYREDQMVGDRDIGLLQESTLLEGK
ncbi:MAG: hypothetical protein LC114_22290 [Bryobacterales bacterium]|nr:hypothetical protein [Bryobacterales bacterium]